MLNITNYYNLIEGKNSGIVSGHAYSCIGIYEYNGDRLLKIRNPWGSYEWAGIYNEEDTN